MTYEEALKRVDYYWWNCDERDCDKDCEHCADSIFMAEQALEKQIPKKVEVQRLTNEEYEAQEIKFFQRINYWCPECGTQVNIGEDNYCSHCGTKLDWSKDGHA